MALTARGAALQALEYIEREYVTNSARPAQETASWSVQRALFKAVGSFTGHAIAAVRALKSSLSATAVGKGPEIHPQPMLAGRLVDADAGP